MIAYPYPGPLLFLCKRILRCLVAVYARTTTCTSSFVAGCWRSVRVFLAPKLYFIFFCTLDTSFAHLLIVFNLSFWELSVLSENDVETKSEYAQSDKYQCC